MKKKRKKKGSIFKIFITVLISAIIVSAFILCWYLFSQPYRSDTQWAIKEQTGAKDAAVFLIGETTTLLDTGNMSKKDEADRVLYDNAIEEHANMFEEFCDVWAPAYRQAAASSLAGNNEKALNKAYKDVKLAFKYYLDESDPSEPIILAGYEQGGEMILRLLEDLFQDDRYRSRLVCAYVINWDIPEEYSSESKNIPLSSGKSQIRVVVTEEESVQTRLETYYRNSITSQAEFVEALGGLEYASARDNIITLKQDVTLSRSIIIAEGTYRLVGNGHRIIRGFEGDLFALTGSDANHAPQLNLGKRDGTDILTLDGNRDLMGEVAGALVAVYGNGTLNIYNGTTLQNNQRTAYDGGAVYGECSFVSQSDGTNICYEPRITVFGGIFQNNSTTQYGGAIALDGVYSTVENRTFGQVVIFAAAFIDNTATNGTKVYTRSATCSYSPELGFANNDLLQE